MIPLQGGWERPPTTVDQAARGMTTISIFSQEESSSNILSVHCVQRCIQSASYQSASSIPKENSIPSSKSKRIELSSNC